MSSFAALNFFTLILKYSQKTVFEQNVAFFQVVFLFTCGNFTLMFTVFSIFWIEFFFKMVFTIDSLFFLVNGIKGS